MAAGTENAAVHHVDAVFRPLDVLQEAEPVIKSTPVTPASRLKRAAARSSMVHGAPMSRHLRRRLHGGAHSFLLAQEISCTSMIAALM